MMVGAMVVSGCAGTVVQPISGTGSGPSVLVDESMLRQIQAELPPAPGTGRPGIPPEMGLITRLGCCGESDECEPGPRTPQWGKFGTRASLAAKSGERLELTCEESGIPFFALWHISPNGERNRVGLCPFAGGCNNARFFYTQLNPTEDPASPDRFVSTRWISKDYGNNDDEDFNAWTKTTDPAEDKLDWAVLDFNALTGNLNKSDFKWEYVWGPPVFECPANPQPEGVLASVTDVDPPVGPETEAFFDSVVRDLQTLAPQRPMAEDTRPPCDFNGDNACDDRDFDFFMARQDSCKGDQDYHPLADIDGSGCIDSRDKYYLYDQDTDGDDVPDIADNCVGTPNPGQADADGDRIGDACENAAAQATGQGLDEEAERKREFAERINNRGFVPMPEPLNN